MILKGGKAKLLVNGIVVAEFNSVDVTETKNYNESDIYEINSLLYHKCVDCGDTWTLSTNDNECMKCCSNNIEHGKN